MKDEGKSIINIPRIGKAAKADFENLGVKTYRDLISLCPRAYEDRRSERRLKSSSVDNTTIYCRIRIERKDYIPSKKGGRTLKILARDDDQSSLELYCFNRDYLDKRLHIGSEYYISASVSRMKGIYRAGAFEIKENASELGFGKILPIYPLSGNLNQKTVRSAVDYALSALSPIEDELPYSFYDRLGLMHHAKAYLYLHHPEKMSYVEMARRTLAFSELFFLELESTREKNYHRTVRPVVTNLEKKLIGSLPFSLTDDQEKAIDEIRADLDSSSPMNRLLEGDVGSGKTLVAWLSALHEIAKGAQVAFMAPTELLAKQHAENAASILEPLGVRICYLTGAISEKGRGLLLRALENGDVDLAIGTHALFTDDVAFRNLRYVIIDEQHRFGVEQRKQLIGKAKDPNILSMTATPIPRSLALTFFSNLDLSVIKTKPNGRLPIKTYLVSEGKRDEMFRSIEVEFQRGHQAYFVYPRIEEDEEGSIKAVEKMYEELRFIYPGYESRMIHSHLKDEEKVDILNRFRAGEYAYLVSTSVIEVGIDIPNAPCMVIEHADRFGLAALHQLRGRVGRSSLPSYCFLVYSNGISEDAKERLKVMRETNDGFVIAEKDLAIRGPGEISGSRQSGFLKLKFASLVEDTDLIALAKEEAERISKDDKGLIKAENAILRKHVKGNIF